MNEKLIITELTNKIKIKLDIFYDVIKEGKQKIHLQIFNGKKAGGDPIIILGGIPQLKWPYKNKVREDSVGDHHWTNPEFDIWYIEGFRDAYDLRFSNGEGFHIGELSSTAKIIFEQYCLYDPEKVLQFMVGIDNCIKHITNNVENILMEKIENKNKRKEFISRQLYSKNLSVITKEIDNNILKIKDFQVTPKKLRAIELE